MAETRARPKLLPGSSVSVSLLDDGWRVHAEPTQSGEILVQLLNQNRVPVSSRTLSRRTYSQLLGNLALALPPEDRPPKDWNAK